MICAMKDYFKRICDGVLAEELAGMGAALVQGPKWCGKTTTCEQLAKSVLYMNDPKRRSQYLQMAESDITELMAGDRPRLIDEWQDAPQFWDAVRYYVDHEDGCGQFILTGSAVPPDGADISHTGTGRIAEITMRPMSLWESRESEGSVSLGALFDGQGFAGARGPDYSLRDMAYLLCRGGWPQAVKQTGARALRRAFNYYDAVVKSDIKRADKSIQDPERVSRLMRSYARLQGTQSGLKSIKLDMRANDSKTLDEDTVSTYIKALKKIFVVEDMPAWSPNLRSKTAIRTSETRYFVDPSVATAALGMGPKDLENDLNTFGLMFETMAVRDLRVYAEALDGDVFHYRDKNGLECDAVIHLHNGSYGLVEIKLGGSKLEEEGAKILKELAGKIDTVRMKEPSFLMVLTGLGSYAYQRKDGVMVVPIGCLKN